MYYFKIVFLIITSVYTVFSLANYVKLTIKLLKGRIDKRTAITQAFTTILIAWMLFYFSLIIWKGNKIFELYNFLAFIPTGMLFSLLLSSVFILPLIYWKTQ